MGGAVGPILVRILSFCLITILGAVGMASAHHSQAQFNLDPVAMETIEGTVTEFDFRSPHVYLYVETEEPDGSTSLWELEATSTPNLIRRGWSRDTLEPGDKVRIDIHPARVPGQHIARVGSVHFADGRSLSATSGGPPAPANARANTLTGRWHGRSNIGQVQLDRAAVPWPLTPKGQAAREAYDGTQNPQVDCIPMTAPTIMLYSTVFDVRLTEDRMTIEGEWLSFERVIYLDGRAHPLTGERSPQGDSVGHWEGATLVVDTTNFADHAAGNSFEIPSGADKNLLERLTLSDDGKRVSYEWVLEDPEYMTEPIVGDGSWEYRPDLERQPPECDLEVARRFIERPAPAE
ncbi:MAG: DUF6152 family protein [Gammaproteobacteria bacterium]